MSGEQPRAYNYVTTEDFSANSSSPGAGTGYTAPSQYQQEQHEYNPSNDDISPSSCSAPVLSTKCSSTKLTSTISTTASSPSCELSIPPATHSSKPPPRATTATRARVIHHNNHTEHPHSSGDKFPLMKSSSLPTKPRNGTMYVPRRLTLILVMGRNSFHRRLCCVCRHVRFFD